MTLAERVIQDLETRRNKILNGGINCIPCPFPRFRKYFPGVEQGRYYLVTSGPKAGKTQFMSFLFFYNSLMYAYHNPDKLRVKFFYFPLEETKEEIITRFLSHLLFTESDIRLAQNDLRSTDSNRPLDSSIIELIKQEPYKSIMDFLEQNVTFSDTRNPTGIFQECRKYAEENGKVFTKELQLKDEFGIEKTVNKFDYYVPDDPDEYRFVIVDHVSLLQTEEGLNDKTKIDKLSEYCVRLRNRYKYSPILIQQQTLNTDKIATFTAKKEMHAPTLGELSDSKYPSRDANLVFGLYDPYKYDEKKYGGYDITQLKGYSRFVEILANRNGRADGTGALFFDGATCFFKELPQPNDGKIINVYRLVDTLDKTDNI